MGQAAEVALWGGADIGGGCEKGGGHGGGRGGMLY
jgi:hypothetical protein